MKELREICHSNLQSPPDTFLLQILGPDLTKDPANRDQYEFVVSGSNNTLYYVHIRPGSAHINPYLIESNVFDSGISSLNGIYWRRATPGPPIFLCGGREGRWKMFMETGVKPRMTPNGQGVSAIAQSEDGHYFAIGTELESDGPGDVAIYLWKAYSSAPGSGPYRTYLDSHTDTLTSLSFHNFHDSSLPEPRTYLLSASTDGLVSITDPLIDDEDEAVVVVFNNKAAISHVVPFQTAAGVQMLCVLSADEKMTVFEVGDLADAKKELEENALVEEVEEVKQRPVDDLRERLNCDYAVTLRSRNASGRLVLVVGAYREETLARDPSKINTPTVDVYICEPAPEISSVWDSLLPKFTHALRLVGAHGQEVVRDIWIRDEYPFVVTCGEDGFLRVWAENAAAAGGVRSHSNEVQDEEMQGVDDDQTPKKRRKRHQKKDKGEKKDKDVEMGGTKSSRFQPY